MKRDSGERISFTTDQVAAATGLASGDLHNHIARGLFPADGRASDGTLLIEGGRRSGARRKFSVEAMVRLAVAGALLSQGMAPRSAYRAAEEITEYGGFNDLSKVKDVVANGPFLLITATTQNKEPATFMGRDTENKLLGEFFKFTGCRAAISVDVSALLERAGLVDGETSHP